MASRLRQKANGWGARVRFGERLSRDEWIHLDVPHDQEPLAEDRLRRLQAMAKRLAELGRHTDARAYLEEAGATRSERGFRAIETMVDELGPETGAPKPKPRTFRQLAQELCDGTLHELYPEDVGFRAQAGRDMRRQQLSTFFPVLGDKLFSEITRDDIDEAKKLLPKGIKTNTRGVYLGELRNLLRLAVEPLRLCEHVPTVKLPQKADTDEFQLFYPDEEEQVAGCTEVSFEERFLYAFLVRNGGRITETLQYTWDHADLERGKFRVAKAWSKTGRARFFDFEPDVLEALRLRRLQIPDSALIFVPPPGSKPFNRARVWRALHPNLRLAGLTRPELFDPDEGERGLTTHDFRASFVTFARTLGMSDRWIMDRTGHEDPKTLAKYDRGVRHAREQELGWWAPMASALRMPGAKGVASRLGRGPGGSEGSGPKPVQSWAKTPETPRKVALRSFDGPIAQGATEPFNTENSAGHEVSLARDDGFGPAQISTSGQSPSGLSAEHLARLHELASRAKQWDLAAVLAVALDAATRAEAPNVASLDEARRRRRDGQ